MNTCWSDKVIVTDFAMRKYKARGRWCCPVIQGSTTVPLSTVFPVFFCIPLFKCEHRCFRACQYSQGLPAVRAYRGYCCRRADSPMRRGGGQPGQGKWRITK